MTNAAFNEVDRHLLRGHGDKTAFFAETASGESQSTTLRWLFLQSVLAAQALRDGLGVTSARRVAL